MYMYKAGETTHCFMKSTAVDLQANFEKCSKETAFIGYSTEATALAVRQAVDDVERDSHSAADDSKVQLVNQ